MPAAEAFTASLPAQWTVSGPGQLAGTAETHKKFCPCQLFADSPTAEDTDEERLLSSMVRQSSYHPESAPRFCYIILR